MENMSDDRFDSAVDRAAERGQGRLAVRMSKPAQPPRWEHISGFECDGLKVQVCSRGPEQAASQFVASMHLAVGSRRESLAGEGSTAKDAVAELTRIYRAFLEPGLGALNATREHFGLPEVERRRCGRCDRLRLAGPGSVSCSCDDPEGGGR